MYSRGGYALIRQTLAARNVGAPSRQASHARTLLGKVLLAPGLRGTKYLSNVPDYEEKYREKLLQRAREKGVATIDELKQKIAAQERKHSVDSAESQQATSSPEPVAPSPKTPPKSQQSGGLPPNVKTLDQIVRLDKLRDKSTEEVGQIWTAFHAAKNCISAAIPAHTYRQLLAVARKNPLFVLPLPREQGIEFFLLQFDYHQVHFTSLLEYKTNTVSARPFLTLTHYTDLIDSKGLVLMRGDVGGDSGKMLDVQNAQYLALQLQQFYVTGGPEKRALLEKFNQNPDAFDHNELIEAAQKL